MRHVIPGLLLCLPLLAGCQRDPAPSGTSLEDTLAEAAEGKLPGMENARAGKPEGPSFADWKPRLDALMPLEMVAAATGLPAADAKVSFRPGGSLTYSWAGERTWQYKGNTLPKHDVVSLSTLMSGVTREFFLSRFTPPTQEQLAAAEQALEEHMGTDQGGNAALGKGLMGAMSQRDPVEPVEGIGDAAMWEMRADGQSLHLYHNTCTAELVVNISDDPAVNKAIAIALARDVIKRL